MRVLQLGIVIWMATLAVVVRTSGVVIHVPADQPTIQAGIDAAQNGDTVLVADGIYTGDGNRDISFTGKIVTVASENGPLTCIINCQGSFQEAHRGFLFNQSEGDTAILDGFSIINGYAVDFHGGAIRIENSGPTIKNCLIAENTALLGGAGIFLQHAKAEILNCRISRNHSRSAICIYHGTNGRIDSCIIDGNEGGSFSAAIEIWDDASNIEITNCLIEGHRAEDSGGGIYTRCKGSVTIAGCTIIGNSANGIYPLGFFGGIRVDTSSPIIKNCLIANNSSGNAGGGLIIGGQSGPLIVNCTITGNTAARVGGGVRSTDSIPVFYNCIIWGNTPEEVSLRGTAPVVVQYSDIRGGFDGIGNIDLDPLFIDGPLGSYYLSQVFSGQRADSPCVGSGKQPAEEVCYKLAGSKICLNSVTTRTDNIPDSETVDMGFHYAVPPATATPTPAIHTKTMELILDDTTLFPGDTFHLHYYLHNPDGVEYVADVWILLDVYGVYWCFPEWVNLEDGYDFRPEVNIDPAASYHENVLLFQWPGNCGSSSGLRFLGAAFVPGSFEIIGDLQIINWEYSES